MIGKHSTPPPIEAQARRIRWKTGLTGPLARTVATHVFGEAR